VSLWSLRERLGALGREDDGGERRPVLGQHQFRWPKLAAQPGVELEDVHGELGILKRSAHRGAHLVALPHEDLREQGADVWARVGVAARSAVRVTRF
jgi:hypothetical protein